MHSLDHHRIPLSTTERGVRQGTHPYYGASGVIDFVDDYLFDEPLLLVSEDGANLLGRRTPIAFVAAGKYWVNNHAHILKPIENEPPNFWAYRIETASIAPFITGSAQPKFTIEALMNMPITAPPTVTERREIVAFLEHHCSKIDALIAKSTEMIETLREYRSALIANAVTGKIDVREAV
nr:restriction endonuclease subunit S [Dietzia sp. DQ11-38-2]